MGMKGNAHRNFVGKTEIKVPLTKNWSLWEKNSKFFKYKTEEL